MSNERTIKPNDPADFTPSLGNYKSLQPFRFWCQKVLPLVYDDSLSYYELLCKVVDYLNKTMEDVETLNGDVTSLHAAYEKLQGYVNDYFSTLDVQEEINNKLDALAKDGTLTNLIKTYIDPLIDAQNKKIVVLENRINAFESLPDGSTTADAELIDIRVPAYGFNDNNNYPTAGDAVRGQVGTLKDDLDGQSELTYNLWKIAPMETSFVETKENANTYWDATKEVATKIDYVGAYKSVDPIKVKIGEKFHIKMSAGTSTKTAPVLLVDINYKIIQRFSSPNEASAVNFDIPIENTKIKYILITTAYDFTHLVVKKEYISSKKTKNVFEGLYLSILGDSISSYIGTIPSGNTPYYTGTNAGVTSPDQMWWKILCDELSMIPLVINGWSGSLVTKGIRSGITEASNISRCQALHTDEHNPDIILIAMGVNDYSYNAPLGTWDGSTAIENTDDFSQAYAYMLDKIHSAYPKAQIFCITPWFVQRGTDVGATYINALKLTENNYSEKIKYIASIMNAKTIDGTNIGFNKYNYYPKYCQDNQYNPTHPNNLGQNVMGVAIAKALTDLFSENLPV